MIELLARYGSFRRLIEGYWRSELTAAEEATIEDKCPKETLVSYKPIESNCARVHADLLTQEDRLETLDHVFTGEADLEPLLGAGWYASDWSMGDCKIGDTIRLKRPIFPKVKPRI